MTRTRDRVSEAAGTVKPYVERAVSDEELRDHVKSAFSAARQVYDELAAPRRGVSSVAARVATDKEIQDSLRKAVEELRSAADRLHGRKNAGGRNATLLLAGIAAGVLFNPLTGPDTRRWLKAKLFGSGEFAYTPGKNGN